jgi:hypothetical protein
VNDARLDVPRDSHVDGPIDAAPDIADAAMDAAPDIADAATDAAPDIADASAPPAVVAARYPPNGHTTGSIRVPALAAVLALT